MVKRVLFDRKVQRQVSKTRLACQTGASSVVAMLVVISSSLKSSGNGALRRVNQPLGDNIPPHQAATGSVNSGDTSFRLLVRHPLLHADTGSQSVFSCAVTQHPLDGLVIHHSWCIATKLSQGHCVIYICSRKDIPEHLIFISWLLLNKTGMTTK